MKQKRHESGTEDPSTERQGRVLEAIEAKQAAIGMDRQMVQMAMGHPQHKVRETKDGVEQEDWIYGTPPQKVIFVTFEGEEVVDIKEYRSGVAGQTQPPLEDPMR